MTKKFQVIVTSVLASSALAELVKIDGQAHWDKVVGKGKPVLVKFYAPWCGFCVRMAEGYEAAANHLNGVADAVVAELNCDEENNKALMSKYGVRGFPTLLWFDADGNKHDYSAGRDYDSITGFVMEKAGDSSPLAKYMLQAKGAMRQAGKGIAFGARQVWEHLPNLPEIPKTFPTIGGGSSEGVDHGNSDLLSLKPDNLEQIIARGNVLVKFFAPWCGHCKSMKQDYEEVAKKIHADHKSVTVAEFDCTQDGANDLSKKYSPDGFPTVLWFPASGSHWEYNGARDQASFQKFVADNAKGADPLAAVKEAVMGGLKKANDVGLVIRAYVEDAYAHAKALALNQKGPIIGTGDNIARIVGAKNALVKFYAPWCGFCKRMKPEYEAAAVELHAKYPNVQIVDFDCDEPVHGRMKCGEYDVKGYPTLKWFDANGDVVEFDGGRDKAGIVSWVSNKMGGSADAPAADAAASEEPELDGDLVVYSPKSWEVPKNTLVKFFAPWCGFCKKMAADYKSAASKVKGTGGKLADFDCTKDGADAVSKKYGVRGFPTLMWFDADGKHHEYDSGRDEASLVKYVENKMGAKAEL